MNRSVAEPVVQRDTRFEGGEITSDSDRAGRIGERLDGDPGEAPADADPLRPRVDDLGYGQPGYGENIDRLRDRIAQRADLLDGTQPRRIQDVGAGVLERSEPSDRVGEVGVAPD